MTPLRFRLWDITYKHMITSSGDPFFDGLCIGLDGKVYSVGDSDGNGGWCYSVDDKYIKLRLTGLKDNTKWEQLTEEEQNSWTYNGNTKENWEGKEIFEGDIIKYEAYNEKKELDVFVNAVFWEENFAAFSLGDKHSFWALSVDDNKKIIGNVYQDSHLLDNPNI